MRLIKLSVALLCASLLASDTNSVPDIGVVVSTDTVIKTVSREPRMVIWLFADDGTVSMEDIRETVTRIGTNVISKVPFTSDTYTWQEVTNTIPAMTLVRDQYKAAAKASMTNTP
jgi:hypothetical protein